MELKEIKALEIMIQGIITTSEINKLEETWKIR